LPVFAALSILLIFALNFTKMWALAAYLGFLNKKIIYGALATTLLAIHLGSVLL